MPKTEQINCRVYYEDTDSGGIVYHASYLKFAERGRTEFLRAAGFDHAGLKDKQRIVFAVAEMSVVFKSPARLDDMLTVETSVVGLSGARVDMLQQVKFQDGALSCELRVTLAALGAENYRAARIPDSVHEKFRSLSI
jgi:acyl-CoA thioester hydrolase